MADESNISDNLNNPSDKASDAPAQDTAASADNQKADNNMSLPDDLVQLLNNDKLSPADDAHIPQASPTDEMPTDEMATDEMATSEMPTDEPENLVVDNLLAENQAPAPVEQSLDIDGLSMHRSEAEVADAILYQDTTILSFDVDSTAIGDVSLKITAEVGSTELRIEQLMKIGRGAIIEIDKDVDGTIDLRIGNHLIGTAQLENNNGYFSVRILEMNTHNFDEHHTLFHATGDE